MLSALSKMAARNCIFVKCFLKKHEKSTPLQLNFECSGAFWLNLVTLHCEPVRFPGVAIPPIFEQLRPKIGGIYFYPGDCDRRESPCGATPVTSVTGSQWHLLDYFGPSASLVRPPLPRKVGAQRQPISAARAWPMRSCRVCACRLSVMAPTMGSPTMLPLRSTT